MAAPEPTQYVGRFAPSPTGPLHFGSLLAAVASYLQAKSRSGRWLLRVEDIDPPRQQQGAIEEILTALERYGFEWDGSVSYQRASLPAHQAAIETLVAAQQAYRCGCSRKDLADAAKGPLGTIYPGTCRTRCDATETAIRVLTDDHPVAFVDGLQGPQEQRLESESGDFIILRRDRLIAYHLAVVVDDYGQQITEVIRGIDLLDSTPRQIWLQRLLGYPTPSYSHIPVVIHPDGRKLSKATGASGISPDHPRRTLVAALGALGQKPPADLRASSLTDIWRWATDHWRMSVMAGRAVISTGTSALAAPRDGGP